MFIFLWSLLAVISLLTLQWFRPMYKIKKIHGSFYIMIRQGHFSFSYKDYLECHINNVGYGVSYKTKPAALQKVKSIKKGEPIDMGKFIGGNFSSW